MSTTSTATDHTEEFEDNSVSRYFLEREIEEMSERLAVCEKSKLIASAQRLREKLDQKKKQLARMNRRKRNGKSN